MKRKTLHITLLNYLRRSKFTILLILIFVLTYTFSGRVKQYYETSNKQNLPEIKFDKIVHDFGKLNVNNKDSVYFCI